MGLISFNLYAQIGFAPFKTESGGIDLKIFGNGVHQLRNDPGQADPTSFYSRNTTFSNNNRPFHYLDIDADPSTFNSSTASYILPAGHEIVSATLHWGGAMKDNNPISTFDPDNFTAIGLANGPMPVGTYDRRNVKLSFDGGLNYLDVTNQAYRELFTGNRAFSAALDITTLAKASVVNNQLSVTVANMPPM